MECLLILLQVEFHYNVSISSYFLSMMACLIVYIYGMYVGGLNYRTTIIHNNISSVCLNFNFPVDPLLIIIYAVPSPFACCYRSW